MAERKATQLSSLQFVLVAAALSQCLLSPLSAAPASKGNGMVDAVKLTQTHFYWGETETTVSQKGIRISNQGRQKFTLVAASPSWTVTIFRDDDRTYIRESLAQYESTGIVSALVLNKPERTERYKGLPQKMKIGDRLVDAIRGNREEFAKLPLGNIAAPEVERILSTTYRLPTDQGIPLFFTKKQQGIDRMSGLDKTGERRIYLKTSKIENIRVSPSIFTAPSGYRLCKSMQEVVLSKANREASGDFDEMFEAGQNSRKNK